MTPLVPEILPESKPPLAASVVASFANGALDTCAVALAVVLFGLLAVGGCSPKYPACDTDKQCQPNEFCVSHKCQQCRSSSDCKEGLECKEGKCSVIAGFCKDSSSCPEGQACINSHCQSCVSDTECPSGLICVAGRCGPAQCKTEDECPQDKDCIKGRCIAPEVRQSTVGPPCPLSPIYFGFNESGLSPEATTALATDLECLKKAPDRSVSLVGRADPRGTEEYNLALSDKRGQSAKDHLKRLGVDANRLRILPRGALDARGSDEAGWAKDRRVDLEWQ